MKLPVGMSLKEEMWVSLRTISGRTGVPDEDRSLMSRTAHRLSPAARQCKVQEGGQFSAGCPVCVIVLGTSHVTSVAIVSMMVHRVTRPK